MNDEELIASGALERYVLGQGSPEEAQRVEAASISSALVAAHLGGLREGMERAAQQLALAPSASAKNRVLDAIAAEIAARDPDRPPVLHAGSQAVDFARWIDRPEMVEDPANENIYFVPLANNSDGLTALVWMRIGADAETHTDCLEQFLILEGTCDITFSGHTHSLKAGDYLKIPLHTSHTVKVTSKETCRIIVQRLAA